MTQREAARYIGINKRTLRRYTQSGRIHPSRNAGSEYRELFYALADCDSLKRELRIETQIARDDAQTTDNSEFMNQEQAVAYLEIDPKTLRKLANEGRIYGREVHSASGRRVEYRRDDVERLRQELRHETETAQGEIEEPQLVLPQSEPKNEPQRKTSSTRSVATGFRRSLPLSRKLLLSLEECLDYVPFSLENLREAAEEGLLDAHLAYGVEIVRPSELCRFAREISRPPASRDTRPEDSPVADSPLVQYVIELARQDGHWEGSPAQLLETLNEMATEEARSSPHWPRNSIAMGMQMGKLAVHLRPEGIEIRRLNRTNTHGRRIQMNYLALN